MIKSNIASVPASGIRKYFDLLNEMEDVISLGIGEPDFVTPFSIMQAAHTAMDRGHTHYSSNMGFISLREEIAKYMKNRYGLSYCPKDEILVTVGASEAIDLALRCLLGPGDEVIIPEPSFVAYKGCATFTGATVVTVDLDKNNRFKLTKEALEKAITERTRVIIFPFPNNPTGSIMKKEDMAEIADFLKDKDLVIISDEIYSELTYNGGHVSIASFDCLKEKTLVINGFSKAFAMTGWRLGYACGCKELIHAMNKIHQYAIMCAPSIAQYAAMDALRNGADDVRYMVEKYNQRRRIIVNGFNEIGLDCFEPEGAFYAFPSIKRTGMTSDEFCESLLKEEHVLMVPGNAFGKSGEGYARATYASSIDNILEALDRIDRFLRRRNIK
ncbi:MAG: aminotransferase class I/II-fold pyridoxal phosphate-dependent enzyme [Clostridia bacterium]|jgi:aminotransferase|nr:aminotransferase class I/II-fold pyridoxal phosphate-dependent enzyme [Clostridiaceae bacterium]